ncbi:alpha-1,2-fucosyltransferase [Prosthecobacter sp.]|jgi:hypothetical protein|uniref:alpha-1,2-fucosyltransferase n=1 Tax=Prosthecobacter sp. TaxID=1965333 RepID=UPI0037CBA9BE
MTLDGGLGNMMFQYAFALEIERQKNCRVRFVSSKPTVSEEMNVFSLEQKIKSCAPPISHLIAGKIRKTLTGEPRIIEETSFAYDPTFISRVRDNRQVVGYFQSPKYWAEIEAEVKRHLMFDASLSDFTNKIEAEISKTLAVAVHVRRGDYLKLSHTHHVLGTDYYRQAIAFMEERTSKQAVYFVFSNDLDWAEKHLPIPERRMRIVRNPAQGLDFEDLYLMTKCRHHIIANSSFSWWGAFLAAREGQQVAAPLRWFTPLDKNQDVAASLYQQNWSLFPS